MFTTEYTETIL